MSYAVGARFDRFIREKVLSGRYNNASEVVREGLRLVEEREAKLNALKQHLDKAIDCGGDYSDADVQRALKSSPA